ncbi:hypothetical protein [Streptomyces sp. NPDC051569]|uniref:hypothetical protein n=1 Tax=Streptomyces sp. NPDC051569 TaxID=3365661 RepID=UPI0037AA5ACC
MGDGTLYGLGSLLIGGAFSVVVAWISRPAPPTPQDVPAAIEPDDGRLTTVEGIAAVVVQQGRRIHQLEAEQAGTTARVGALTRYVRVLKGTIASLGGEVPEPVHEDRHLIEQ